MELLTTILIQAGWTAAAVAIALALFIILHLLTLDHGPPAMLTLEDIWSLHISRAGIATVACVITGVGLFTGTSAAWAPVSVITLLNIMMVTAAFRRANECKELGNEMGDGTTVGDLVKLGKTDFLNRHLRQSWRT